MEALDHVELVRLGSLSVVEAFFAKLKEIKESSREVASLKLLELLFKEIGMAKHGSHRTFIPPGNLVP